MKNSSKHTATTFLGKKGKVSHGLGTYSNSCVKWNGHSDK